MTLELREKFAMAVCEFLSEMLRTRRVSLTRGTEIAAALLPRLEQIRTEEEFHRAVRELEFEFQEMRQLGDELQLHSKISERKEMEKLVRDYAAEELPLNPGVAVKIMQDALLPGMTPDWLLRKYPELNSYKNER